MNSKNHKISKCSCCRRDSKVKETRSIRRGDKQALRAEIR